MPITVLERAVSRDQTMNASDSEKELACTVIGSEDDLIVGNAAMLFLPNITTNAIGSVLNFTDLKMHHLGGGVTEVTARYRESASLVSFDTSGGTQRIRQSIKTVGRYAASGTTPQDYRGAIGVNGDTVEGCEIPASTWHWKETYRVPLLNVTLAYRAILRKLTGSVNLAQFRDCDAGEARFLGASGQQRGLDAWEITFSFEGSQNAFDIPIGIDRTGTPAYVVASKMGWEYLWTVYIDKEDSNVLVKQPVASYVEQVCPDGDFSLLGIGN